MVTQCTDLYYIYDQTDTLVVAQTAVSVCWRKQEEWNSTTSQRRRQTSSNVARAGKLMRAGHRQRGGFG